MDFAAATAISMILVCVMGIATGIAGIIVYNESSKSRIERLGWVLGFVGIALVLLSFVGWFISIWLGFAQSAAS